MNKKYTLKETLQKTSRTANVSQVTVSNIILITLNTTSIVNSPQQTVRDEMTIADN